MPSQAGSGGGADDSASAQGGAGGGCLWFEAGRRGAKAVVEPLRKAGAALVVVNAETASGGNGCTAREARELLGAGIDVLTMGNHVWKHKDLLPVLEAEPRLLRPAGLADHVAEEGDAEGARGDRRQELEAVDGHRAVLRGTRATWRTAPRGSRGSP